MSTELIQSGGSLQVLALSQIIYLDFNGELASYQGERLTIDEVAVEDSRLSEERIAQITAALNEQFAGQNVRFMSDKSDLSDRSDYSTIYIGKTSSFEPYGHFAGLAETIDSGNRIKNDNAFVILDASSDDAQLIETIAHEAGHLLGTLDHGGEGLAAYAYYQRYDVYSGVTSTGLTLDYDSMYVSHHGVADLTTVGYGARMAVSSGGYGSRTVINAGGTLSVLSCGIVNETAVNSGGTMMISASGFAEATVENGGYVNVGSGAVVTFTSNFFSGLVLSDEMRATLHSGTTAAALTLNNRGYANIYSSGFADGVVVNSGGYLSVSSGGTAADVVWTPCIGGIWVEDGAIVNFASSYTGVYVGSANKLFFSTAMTTGEDLYEYCSMYVMNGGLAEKTSMCRSYMYISSGGTATDTGNWDGEIKIFNGGTANATSGGRIYVFSGGTAKNTSNGTVYVYSAGSVDETEICGGLLDVFSGGTADHTWVTGAQGCVVVYDGALLSNTVVESGTLKVSGGIVSSTELVNAVKMNIYGGLAKDTVAGSKAEILVSGGTVSQTVVGSGASMVLFSGGTASSATVNAGGRMILSSGAAAWNVIENGGFVLYDPEADVRFVKHTVSGITVDCAGNLHSGTTLENSIIKNCNFDVYSGAAVNSTSVEQAALKIYDGGEANHITAAVGSISVLSGGKLTDAAISGMLIVSGGGKASNATIQSGSANIYDGAVADSIEVNSGRLYVASGGVASHTIISSSGVIAVDDGAVVSHNSVWGEAWIYGSADENTIYGYLTVRNTGVTDHTVVSGGVNVYSGTVNSTTVLADAWLNGYGTFNNTVAYGKVEIYRGSVFQTTIHSGGRLVLSSSAQCSKTTISSGGTLLLAGSAFDTVICSGGYASANGVLESLQLEGGKLVLSGGSALGTVVHSGGEISIIEGSASNTTLHNGRIMISSGCSVENMTIGKDGLLTVYWGGNAAGITLESGGGVDASIRSYLQGTYADGTEFFISGWSAKNVTGGLDLGLGGSAVNTTILSGRKLEVANNGTAEGVRIQSDGCLSMINGRVSGVVLESGAYVNAYADSCSLQGINADGTEFSIGNKVARNIYGALKLDNGALAVSTTVRHDLTMEIRNATHTGTLFIEDGATVTVTKDSLIDFTVAEQTAPAVALINDWSRITNGSAASYTITVNAEQDSGTYLLAGGAAGFANSITVKTTGGKRIGTVSLGTALVAGPQTYTLDLADDKLSLSLSQTILSTITITANSAARMYDGTALTDSGFSYTGELADGDKLSVVVKGAVTDAGTGANKVTEYKVMRGSEDVTNWYRFTASVDGTLTVTQRSITLTSASDEKPYDGTALTNDTVTVSGDGFVGDEGCLYRVTGNRTQVGTSKNTFSYAAADGTNLANYKITKTEGDLTVTEAPVKNPAKSDIDGNGISDVMFQYTGGDYQIGFWMNGTNAWKGSGMAQPEEWTLAGAYDMDGDGCADALMRGDVTVGGHPGTFIGYYQQGSSTAWKTIGFLDNPDGIDWELTAGNLTGKVNANSIVWHAPELSACGVWKDGTTEWISIAGGFDASWSLQGTGDFTGDGKDEILWQHDGALYTTDINGNFASLGDGWGDEWQVRAIGDFSGDGQDDIVLFLEETGSVVKFTNGQSSDWESLGQLDAKDWFIVGAGDYDNDQKDDLLVRQYSTGMLGYYSAGDMSKWSELGRGVDMNWTVIA